MGEYVENQPLIQSPRPTWTCSLMLSISMAVIGCSFQFGFQTGNMANTQGILKAVLGIDDTFIAFIIAAFPAGGFFGGLSAGYFADKIGRKRSMLLNNIPLLIGTALMVISYDRWFFLSGRIIAGFACGISTGLAPMYISEISPISVRGAVGVMHQFMITFGILIGYVISMKQVIGDESHYYWRIYFALPILPSLYQMLLLVKCPESPNWLYYNREREDLAKAALAQLRNDVSKATEEVEAFIEERTSRGVIEEVSIKDLFTERTLRLTLFIGVGLQMCQQLSGINAILNYAPSIFREAKIDNPDLPSIALSAVNVLMTFISVPLMDKMGRRTLMVGGLLTMIVSYLGLATAQSCQSAASWHCSGEWNSVMSVATAFTFVIGFAVGPGSIPWLIISEIFKPEARGRASSICVGVNWLCNFLVCVSYDALKNAIAPYTFFLYTGIVVLSFAFTLLFVPETKGKSVDQISRELEIQAAKPVPILLGTRGRPAMD